MSLPYMSGIVFSLEVQIIFNHEIAMLVLSMCNCLPPSRASWLCFAGKELHLLNAAIGVLGCGNVCQVHFVWSFFVLYKYTHSISVSS
jgi:hypothetical protein